MCDVQLTNTKLHSVTENNNTANIKNEPNGIF